MSPSLLRCAPLRIRVPRRAVLSTNQALGAHIRHQHLSPPKHFKVTLDGDTLYVDKELAEALGWREDTPTEGVPLRLSGWSPHYFAITQKGTDAGKQLGLVFLIVD